MKKWLVASVAVAALLFAREVSASTIQFNLDCTIVDATTCTPGGPGGYIKLTDNGNNIDVEVAVNAALRILNVNLNWFNNTPPLLNWQASGGNLGANTAQVDVNNIGPFGRFDIRISDSGPNYPGDYANPLTFTLSNSVFGDLDTSMFFAKDDVNQLWGGVRMSAVPGTGTDGAAYGASTVAPEPATLALLGIGLSVAALAVRRRKA